MSAVIKPSFARLIARYIFLVILEKRVSQNLVKLGRGGGGAHKRWEDRREMK